MNKLKDKIAIISGGTSGLGLATTKAFIAEGAKVIVAARSYEKFIQNLGEPSSQLKFIATDFSDMESVKDFYQKIIKTYKSIDIAINNVGATKRAPFLQFEEKDFDWSINLNLKSVWLSMQYQIELMQKEPEKFKYIVNTASSTSLGGTEYQSIYSAAKAGVIALTKSVARELAMSNITANVIIPGPHATPLVFNALKKEANGDAA